MKAKKKKEKESKAVKNFIAFGNKRKVFWSITISTIILTLIGIPIIINNENMLRYFIAIWILELIYILIYLKTKDKQ